MSDLCKEFNIKLFAFGTLAGGFLFIVANGTKAWAIGTKKKYVRL